MVAPVLRVSVNGGAPQTLGVEAPAAAVLTFSFNDTNGWRAYRVEVLGPPAYANPAGWTQLDADGLSQATGVTTPPPSITLPAISGWGKWAFKLAVTLHDGSIVTDDSLIVSMLSASGLEDTAPRERGQFSTLRAWARAFQKNWRVIDAVLASVGGGGGAGGDLAGTYPNPTVAKISGVAGLATLAAAALDWTGDGAATHGARSAEGRTTLASSSATTLYTTADLAASSLMDLSYRVALRKPDGTSYAATIVATYKRVSSAAPVLVGTASVSSRADAGAAAWGVAFAVVGNAIALQVTGENTVVATFEGAYLRNG
jgi:hypothetical protein